MVRAPNNERQQLRTASMTLSPPRMFRKVSFIPAKEVSAVSSAVAGRHFQLRLKMDLKGIDLSLIFDLFNYLHRPDGLSARYCQGQHYWEQGMRGFTARALRSRFSSNFHVLRGDRNRDWLPSYNWILRSNVHGA